MSDNKKLNIEEMFLERLTTRYKKGNFMRFIDADDVQVNWGNNDDPRLLLEKERIYKIEEAEFHSYHTKLSFEGVKGKFNSASFKWIDHMSFKGMS